VRGGRLGLGTAEEGLEVVFDVVEFEEFGGGFFGLLQLDCRGRKGKLARKKRGKGRNRTR
jgi:hypothetical protein